MLGYKPFWASSNETNAKLLDDILVLQIQPKKGRQRQVLMQPCLSSVELHINMTTN
jgi:hypothetical protein